MKRVFSIVFALVLVVGLGLVTASLVLAAGTIHVPGDYPTIQQAIDAAAPGDTIMVAAGTYAAFQAIGKNNIHMIGAEGATVATTNLYTALPVVGNAWVLAAVYNSTNINIEGINFDGTGVSGKRVFVGIAYVDSTGTISRLTVENVIATELGAGVAIIGHVGSSAVEMTGATISDNDKTGIYVCGGSTLEAHFNKIVDNAECGVLNDGGKTVDATGNWWGHKSGPRHLTNLLGMGNAVIGDVGFKPWLGAADIVIQTVTNKAVDARAEIQTEVVVTGTATVIIAKYASNPYPSAGVYAAPASLSLAPLLNELEELNIFRDVCIPDTEPGTKSEIRLYYMDEEAEGFDEESLRLLWHDGNDWVACSDSGVNTASVTVNATLFSGYMWAKITEDSTPSLADLQRTPWGGYGHPSVPSGACGCFIATAAYGTDTAREIDILREFRDEVLLPNISGARLVSFYYRTSPPIADFISQQEILRTTVKVAFVDPIVKILNWTHDLWSVRRL
jgi:hypothetical protein